jgi:transcriptional regulator with XRE-family HTH domain
MNAVAPRSGERMAGLGEILRQTREQRGITLEEAERVTRIARRYLVALEEEDFSAFPAPVFGRGFLRNYGQFLGLNADDLLALWPGEGLRRAAPHEPVAGEPSTRGLRFPWRGQARPAEEQAQTEAEGEAEGLRPRLPRWSPLGGAETLGSGSATPRSTRGSTWQRLPRPPRPRGEAPGPLSRGVAPEYGSWPSGRLAGTLIWLAPLVCVLVIALGLAHFSSSSAKVSAPAPVTAGTPAAPTANVPARQVGAMPRLTDLDGAAAVQQMRALGIEPLVITVSEPTATPGKVLDQDPAPGTRLSTTTTVTLVIAAGGALLPVAPSTTPAQAISATPAPGGVGGPRPTPQAR